MYVQKELKEEIRKEKEQYKQKVASYFTCNNMRSVCSGMKLMSRYANDNTQKIVSVDTADEVNRTDSILQSFRLSRFLEKT